MIYWSGPERIALPKPSNDNARGPFFMVIRGVLTEVTGLRR